MVESRPLLNVVVFAGGRGSAVISAELIRDPRVRLTLAINGYDDGLSTGAVRHFLGDCLGPSDFRKNASRLAEVLQSCAPELVELLDLRFPEGFGDTDANAAMDELASESLDWSAEAGERATAGPFLSRLTEVFRSLPQGTRHEIGIRISAFRAEARRTGRRMGFADCSIGNLVFAGCFLERSRRFNDAVDDYCALLGLPAGTIDNVTDGSNAWLVAVDTEGELLPSEAAIVSANQPQRIREIHLLDRPVTPPIAREMARSGDGALERFLRQYEMTPVPNPRILSRIAAADLIVYAPGTQHSSLFPSYLTPGIGAAIAGNLRAVKLLITNLREDTEMSGESAVDLIGKALFFLRERGRRRFPSPSLITHYLINDPAETDSAKPYVPLGNLDSLDDPRLVRIGDYEDGVTGRHSASRVITPFIEGLLRRDEPIRVGVLLMETTSVDKLSQTMVEMVRAGVDRRRLAMTVWYAAEEPCEPAFVAALPFSVRHLGSGGPGEPGLRSVVNDPQLEYLVLFDSSGMYRGEDIVTLTRQLQSGRLDAVWGSRRLSVNDIRQAYRMVYRHHWIKGAVSYVGSHLLSLAYLMLYGRYVSDTLSGARAIRIEFARAAADAIGRPDFNHVLLSNLLRRRAELVEAPVWYFPISPSRVRRTTVTDGLHSLLTILRMRWTRGGGRAAGSPPVASSAHVGDGVPLE